MWGGSLTMLDSVALLTEGVDRNVDVMAYAMAHSKSPSSRRAWIEIPCPS